MNLVTQKRGNSPEILTPSPLHYIRITDGSLCIGCRICELVCSLYHERECSSNLARIYVLKDLFTGTYTQYTCHQCKVPKCLDACPEGAIVIDSNTGAKTIDINKCTGCRLCEEACIYNPPSRIKFNAERNICIKCDLCFGDPQCVKYCPEKILEYAALE